MMLLFEFGLEYQSMARLVQQEKNGLQVYTYRPF